MHCHSTLDWKFPQRFQTQCQRSKFVGQTPQKILGHSYQKDWAEKGLNESFISSLSRAQRHIWVRDILSGFLWNEHSKVLRATSSPSRGGTWVSTTALSPQQDSFSSDSVFCSCSPLGLSSHSCPENSPENSKLANALATQGLIYFLIGLYAHTLCKQRTCPAADMDLCRREAALTASKFSSLGVKEVWAEDKLSEAAVISES